MHLLLDVVMHVAVLGAVVPNLAFSKNPVRDSCPGVICQSPPASKGHCSSAALAPMWLSTSLFGCMTPLPEIRYAEQTPIFPTFGRAIVPKTSLFFQLPASLKSNHGSARIAVPPLGPSIAFAAGTHTLSYPKLFAFMRAASKELGWISLCSCTNSKAGNACGLLVRNFSHKLASLVTELVQLTVAMLMTWAYLSFDASNSLFGSLGFNSPALLVGRMFFEIFLLLFGGHGQQLEHEGLVLTVRLLLNLGSRLVDLPLPFRLL